VDTYSHSFSSSNSRHHWQGRSTAMTVRQHKISPKQITFNWALSYYSKSIIQANCPQGSTFGGVDICLPMACRGSASPKLWSRSHRRCTGVPLIWTPKCTPILEHGVLKLLIELAGKMGERRAAKEKWGPICQCRCQVGSKPACLSKLSCVYRQHS
jgi:hypothetical protein